MIETSPWGGGSYGHGKLPTDYADHPTPSPRHTYDGICYVESDDAMCLVLGANSRIGGTGSTDEAKAALGPDMRSTWKYSFADRRSTLVETTKALAGAHQSEAQINLPGRQA